MPSANLERHRELVFGLVGAVGIDFDPVVTALQASLGDVGYKKFQPIRLSELVDQFDVWDGEPPRKVGLSEDERIDRYMTAGNNFREKMERGDALVAAAIERIWEIRRKSGKTRNGGLPEGIDNCAYILRSLKHPGEVRRLQTLYGPGFLLVGIYLPEDVQLEKLMRRIADSRHTDDAEQFKDCAQALLKRDSYEPETDYGQNVRDTFALSDLFVDASDEEALRESIDRFIELLFGHPNYTPTRDEYAMFHAYAEATISSSLSRQVGASIATHDGQIVSSGTNEVPKPLGGIYWEKDLEDDRDFRRGFDSNEFTKNEILYEVFQKLKKDGWLSEAATADDVSNIRKELHGTRLLDLIEFHRANHAETAALLDAARRGVSVQGCTLYCTTFPCHNCARHIIAAGIQRVVYIEPYPKSKAQDFYTKAFTLDSQDKEHVRLLPFVGVGPRRYRDLFSMTTSEGLKIERMNKNTGEAIKAESREMRLRWGTLNTSQFENEAGLLKNVKSPFSALRLKRKGGKK
jgi:cytidine deaminase